MDSIYKVFQAADIFITKYGYNQIMLDTFSAYADRESWLFNNDSNEFQLIRITLLPASASSYDSERIRTYIDYFTKTYNREIRFLDIHISKDEYDENLEEYPYLNMEQGYRAGTDISSVYPELNDVIHEVEDPRKEISIIIDRMRKAIMARNSKSIFKRSVPLVTYIIIALCCINYLLCLYLEGRYSDTTAYVLMGADYMTFNLGLHQYYRFLSCGFVHGGFIHLFSNMYSLYILGNYAERSYGRVKFILILTVCVLAGSLSEAILSGNTILVGMSAGLYGLMIFYILDLIIYRKVPVTTFMPLILINIGINFLSTTAFIAHLGGLIAGYLMYLIFNRPEKRSMVVLLAGFLLCLFVKYVTINEIDEFFMGTDLEIVEALRDLGFVKYSEKLWLRLLEVYSRYGG